MAKNKFYAVRSGRKIGIFNNWIECEKSIKGYSGAEYKSFSNYKDAKKYLNGDDIQINNSNPKIDQLKNNEMIAYVDGSYDSNTNYYSYGVVTFFNGNKSSFSDKDNSKNTIKMQNVAGELEGAKFALNKALENNASKLYLYYDYEGIEKWCTGEWETNTTGTRKYKNFYDNIKNKIDVTFIKVKAHTGNKYNEEADSLAKNALKNKTRPNIKNKLAKCTVRKNTILPIFNILTVKGNHLATDDLFKKFKDEWKKRNRYLKDIEDMSIILDLKNMKMICSVEVDNDKIDFSLTL